MHSKKQRAKGAKEKTRKNGMQKKFQSKLAECQMCRAKKQNNNECSDKQAKSTKYRGKSAKSAEQKAAIKKCKA